MTGDTGRRWDPLGSDYKILEARQAAAGRKELKKLADEQSARNEEKSLLWEARHLQATGQLDAETGRFHDATVHMARLRGEQTWDTGRVTLQERFAGWAEQARLEREEQAKLLEAQVSELRGRREPPEVAPAPKRQRLSDRERRSAIAKILGKRPSAVKRSQTPEEYASAYADPVSGAETEAARSARPREVIRSDGFITGVY